MSDLSVSEASEVTLLQELLTRKTENGHHLFKESSISMVHDMLIEENIKASKMWEVNNPRVHGILRNLMLMITNSDTISDNAAHEIFGYVISLIQAYGDKDFKVPIGEFDLGYKNKVPSNMNE